MGVITQQMRVDQLDRDFVFEAVRPFLHSGVHGGHAAATQLADHAVAPEAGRSGIVAHRPILDGWLVGRAIGALRCRSGFHRLVCHLGRLAKILLQLLGLRHVSQKLARLSVWVVREA